MVVEDFRLISRMTTVGSAIIRKQVARRGHLELCIMGYGVNRMSETSASLVKQFEALTSQREKVVKELAVLEAEQGKAKDEAAKIVAALKERNIENFEQLRSTIDTQRGSLGDALGKIKESLSEVF